MKRGIKMGKTKKKGKLLSFDFWQKFGKALLVVIAVMPAAGLMITIGKLLGMYFEADIIQAVSRVMDNIGWGIIGNLHILFAVAIGGSWAKERAGGAFAGGGGPALCGGDPRRVRADRFPGLLCRWRQPPRRDRTGQIRRNARFHSCGDRGDVPDQSSAHASLLPGGGPGDGRQPLRSHRHDRFHRRLRRTQDRRHRPYRLRSRQGGGSHLHATARRPAAP